LLATTAAAPLPSDGSTPEPGLPLVSSLSITTRLTCERAGVLAFIQREVSVETVGAALAAQRNAAVQRIVLLRRVVDLARSITLPSVVHDLLRFVGSAMRVHGGHYTGGLEGAGQQLITLLRTTYAQLLQFASSTAASPSADCRHVTSLFSLSLFSHVPVMAVCACLR
jgi:hypothetical protein